MDGDGNQMGSVCEGIGAAWEEHATFLWQLAKCPS